MKFLLFFFLPFFLLPLRHRHSQPVPNHPPSVKIITPHDGSAFPWNTAVRYKISVSDQEDGESEYGEIAGKQVIVEVKSMKNLSGKQKDMMKKTISIPSGLDAIESSNCFNCHQFNQKSTGPSLREIGMHYAHSGDNIKLLASRIKNGSKGVWANQVMPAHTHLTDKQAQDIVAWIFKHAKDTSLNFYTGVTGSFMIKKNANNKTGTFILTASYTDQGTGGIGRMSGRDRVMIYGK